MTLRRPVPQSPSAPLRAALYLRVSTGRQYVDGISIEDQKKRMHDHCRQMGWQVVAAYEDAKSARDDSRPGFQRLMSDAAKQPAPFDVVVSFDPSRFARNLKLRIVYEHVLTRRGLRLSFVNGEADTETPQGRLMASLLALLAEYENDLRGQRVCEVMQTLARDGRWTGSRPPFGYRVETSKKVSGKAERRLAIDDMEATVVQLIFALRLGGQVPGAGTEPVAPMGVKKIAGFLNKNGYTTREGRRFNLGTVHKILTNQTYAGTYLYGRKETRTGILRAPEKWIRVPVPPIVPEAIFATVAQLLAEADPRTTPPRETASPVLLTGLLRCPHCDAAMTVTTGKSGRYRYYTGERSV